MRRKLIIVLVLTLLFVGFVFVRFFILDAQNANGRIKISSSPSASVFIDNNPVGSTPFEDQLKVGDYMVKLIPNGNATETASWQEKISVRKNTLTYISRQLGSSEITSSGLVLGVSTMDTKPSRKDVGQIYVETEPGGAIVLLNNEEKGVAPLILSDVPQGENELSVKMPGFFPYTEKVNVEAGFKVEARIKLAIDQSQQRPAPSSELNSATPSAEVSTTEIDEDDTNPSASTSASVGLRVRVLDTPTGWLRVREDATVNASESGRVNPGEEFDVLDQKNGWYQIMIGAQKGWISGQYTEKL